MDSRKKLVKGMTIFILATFLLSTALMSVMYFTSPKPQDPNALTGENTTGTTEIATGIAVDATGTLTADTGTITTTGETK